MAEIIADHRARFADEIGRAVGVPAATAYAEVDAAVDRWLWYTGWTDKIAQVRGGANPVAGPYVNITVPEPAGVVAVLAPQESPLLGLVSVLAPAIAGGNTSVVVASERYPLPALGLAEVCAAARLPDGVVNVLTGEVAEVAPWLAAHQDVNAIDLAGRARRARGRPGGGGGGDAQAGGPAARRRLDGGAGARPDVRHAGEQDRLAPGQPRPLTRPPISLATAAARSDSI